MGWGWTFGQAWWWVLIAAAIGALLGWLANGWRKTSDANTQSFVSTSTETTDELDRLRARNANLEPIVADRDHLRSRIGELEVSLREAEAARAAAVAPVAAIAGISVDDHNTVVADRDRLRALVGDHEASVGSLNGRIADLEAALRDCEGSRAAALADVTADRDRVQGLLGEHEGTIMSLRGQLATPVNRFAGFDLDLDRASRVLGERVKLDDLKIVEGIGPKIEELCHEGGITTWAGLADTPVSRLQEILDAAGERYRIHNPATWPKQSGLLALGRWEEFKELTDALTAGRE